MSIRDLDPTQAFKNLVCNMEKTNNKRCRTAAEQGSKKIKLLGFNALSIAVGVAAVARETFILVGIILVTPAKIILLVVRIVSPKAFQSAFQTLDGLPTILDKIARIVAQTLGVGASVVGTAFFFYKGSEWNISLQKWLHNAPSQAIRQPQTAIPIVRRELPLARPAAAPAIARPAAAPAIAKPAATPALAKPAAAPAAKPAAPIIAKKAPPQPLGQKPAAQPEVAKIAPVLPIKPVPAPIVIFRKSNTDAAFKLPKQPKDTAVVALTAPPAAPSPLPPSAALNLPKQPKDTAVVALTAPPAAPSPLPPSAALNLPKQPKDTAVVAQTAPPAMPSPLPPSPPPRDDSPVRVRPKLPPREDAQPVQKDTSPEDPDWVDDTKSDPELTRLQSRKNLVAQFDARRRPVESAFSSLASGAAQSVPQLAVAAERPASSSLASGAAQSDPQLAVAGAAERLASSSLASGAAQSDPQLAVAGAAQRPALLFSKDDLTASSDNLRREFDPSQTPHTKRRAAKKEAPEPQIQQFNVGMLAAKRFEEEDSQDGDNHEFADDNKK